MLGFLGTMTEDQILIDLNSVINQQDMKKGNILGCVSNMLH